MIKHITNIKDVEHLRYDIIRTYNVPGFSQQLKDYVIEQLDRIIAGTLPLDTFISLHKRINQAHHIIS